MASAGTNITLFGGSGNAMLTSTNANNVSMIGGSGNATLTASAGTNITLFGGSGNAMLTSTNANNVSMIGGSGNATLMASAGTNITLFGGSGNSQLTSSNANHVSMIGGSGNATLMASAGTNITLFGGSGNAMLTSTNANNVSMIGGSGNATLMASAGTNITLFGGSGNDSLQATGGSDLVLVGGSGNSQLDVSGSTGATLFGGSGSNTLTAANSNNVSMIGGSGNATLTASGSTSVTLFGGDGSDSLASSNVASLLMTGGAGRDTLTSTNDTDAVLMSGGLSNDRLTVTDGTRVALMGGGGDDTLSAAGGTGISLSGLDGNNLYQLTGTPADPLDVALNDLGTFGVSLPQIDGFSDGVNTLAFPGVTSGITLDLSNASLGAVPGLSQEQQVAPGLTLSLTGYFQNVIGTPGANWIKGDPASNVLQGQGGNDTLIAGSGPATLVARDGSDVLMGGPGGTIYSFAGTNLGSVTVVPASNTSNDTLDFSQLGGGVALDMTSASAQPVSPAAGLTLTVTNPLGITGVVGSAFDNTITGNARDDVFTVGGGNDTITGGGGNDTYVFNAVSHGTKVLDETPATHNTLNFHAFDGPVNANLTQTGPQVVSPGRLTLTLSPPTAFDGLIGSRFADTLVGNDRGDTLIGGGGDDNITSGPGADYVQAGITQVVYLDFDAASQPGYHVYTQDERDAIQAQLEAIYRDFSYVFTQDPTQAAQLSQLTSGQYATLEFNVGVYPGVSHKLDTDHIDLGGLATVNINPALGSSPDLVPDTSANVIGLTATIAAHELGHFSGLEHAASFGPIGTGIYSGVSADKFYPAYTGAFGAVDTPNDVMASPDAVNSPLIDAAGPTQLGERDALHLAFDDSGTLLRSQDLTGLAQPVGVIPGVTSAIVQGALPPLAVPNTLIVPGTMGYGQTFQAVALGVEGTIATPGQEDFYAITGRAGEVMSFEVASQYNTLNSRPFQPELEVLDASGKQMAFSVRNFEQVDPMILDLTLPADGTYYVGVDAYHPQATGDYKLLMYSLTAVTGGTPQGNGATVTSSGGNDTLVGSSANDTFTYTAGATGQVTIDTGSGADVLDLRQAPQVTFTRTGDTTLGSLTVLTQVATSSVAVLPQFSPGTFTLSWSGSGANGIGIASYSIYVSDNGGAFTPQLTDTTQTSTTFTGVNGHTYGFYSIATDNDGNIQPTPTTAQATTTVDTVAPTSSVAPLPSFVLPTFTVRWSGSDNPGGSGLAMYSVFVSDNGGAYAPLLTETTQTSTSFTGVDGHTYSFYSVATDNVGNVQATPTSAQASTTVDATPPTSSVTALPAFSPGSFTLNWSGSDGNGSGIASYSVYVSDNGGAFTPLLTDTKQTSTTFAGVNGHTYSFYSIATDNVGNVQPTPNVAQASTTVDTVAPISSVAALPAFSPASFTVNWSGADNSGGSGLASYSVFVSDNGSPFTAWLTATMQTSASYIGVDGHSYRFYSVATDNVGNVETTPSSAQATTTVDATPPTSTVAALPAFSPSSFTVSWSGSDNPGGSGLSSYSVYVSEDGGAFTLLLADTKQTSTTFTGAIGHIYGFYSVATDNVGNVQPTPTAAQTSTIVTAAPVASGQSVATTENQAKPITLSSTDPNNDPLTYTITTQPTHGKLSGSGANLTYTPKAGFTGSDSFLFTVTDTTTGMVSNTAMVSINVTQPPVSLTVGATFNSTVLQNVTSGSIKLATFNESGGSANPTDYTATVGWGDGISNSSADPNPVVTVTISGTQVTAYGTHTFSTAGLAYPIVTLAYGGSSVSTAAHAIKIDVSADVSQQINSSATPYYYNSLTKATTSTLTVSNKSTSNLTGEFYLALQGLTPGVTLQSASITVGGKAYPLTLSTTGAGDPMIVIPPSLLNTLGAGQSFKIALSFSNPSNKLIKYSTKLYSDPFDTF
jgi:hypothetical protein